MVSHSLYPWREFTDENGDHWVLAGDVNPYDMHSYFIGNLEDTCGECHANAELISMAPILNAALVIAAEDAWQSEVVDPEMEDLIDETREEWISDRVNGYLNRAEKWLEERKNNTLSSEKH